MSFLAAKDSSVDSSVNILVVMQHDYSLDDFDDHEEVHFDQQTQARLDNAVDKLLKGYDWTLAPLANK